MTIELSASSVEFLRALLVKLNVNPAADDAETTVTAVREILKALENQ